MSDAKKPDRGEAKPTPASTNISHGEGSIGDIEDVANDAAEGHAPPVVPQPTPGPETSKPKSD